MDGDCTGSVSNNCADFLRRSVQLSDADDCPHLPSEKAAKQACGDALTDGYEGAISLPPPLPFPPALLDYADD